MATIQIKESCKSVSNKEIKSASHFYCERLLGALSRNINVTIIFENMKDAMGTAEIIGQDDPPNKFRIKLRKDMGYKMTMEILAHEWVHIKQFAKKETLLFQNEDDAFMFHGKYYKVSDFDYYELPDEIEAFGRQYGLYTKWLESRHLFIK